METANVGYICVAATHPARQSPNGTGLTVNDGKWAYCAAGAPDGHEWSPVDRASFDDLTRAAWVAARVTAKS